MDKEKLEYFKNILLKHRMLIINQGLATSTEDLHISSDDLADEADLATSVINQEISFNIRNRELSKLKAIDYALEKIKNGSFGLCEECEEPISEKRLMNQPWAKLCITHAEEEERQQGQFLRAV